MHATAIGKRFELTRALGAGAFGEVFEAFDRERNALKMLRQVKASALTQLKNEFRALADLNHPNLIAVHELACADDQWFFTMELIEDGKDIVAHARSDKLHATQSALASSLSVQ